MKTKEEKAIAYDKAIRKLRGMMPNWERLSYNGKTILQDLIHIFPELAESEDERIGKWLLDFVQGLPNEGLDFKFYNLNKEQVIAWLENAKRQIEKQGEQNHSEQDLEMVTKPKFNIGDWITSDETYINNDYRLCKVVGISDGCYTIQTIDGLKGYNTFKGWESEYRLWSIEDAKPGDVLIDHCDDCKNPLIFILKKFERVDFGLAQKSDYSSYCFLTAGDKQRFKEGTYHHKHNIKPATKEQRDLLFQKMYEAGYTFDFEKKELKKIKFRVGDEIITENEESLTITKIDKEGYWSNDLFICDFDSECVWDLVEKKPTEWSLPYGKNETAEKLIALAEILEMDGDCLFNGVSGNSYGKFLRVLAKELTEVKPAEWSKEDEGVLSDAEGWLDTLCDYLKDSSSECIPHVKNVINRLNTIKNRIVPQTKQEWSDEDEEMCQNILECLRNGWRKLPTDILKYESWLKSPRSHPRQWSEEDEAYVLLIDSICENSEAEYYDRPDSIIREKIVGARNWLKDLKDRVQPKQEWKQENREELTEFENAMMHIGGSFFGENAGLDPNDTDTIKEQAELLLELAPKTEWSEEDERNLRRAIRTTQVVYPVTADWLESIKQRHTWKPSDEQMHMLRRMITALPPGEVHNGLESLYNDLKKLTE